MDKLISAVFDNNSEQLTNSSTLKDLGHCIAYLVVNDFTTRIFPPSSQDNESLEESIASPIFVLCRSAFSINQSNFTTKPMSLLVSIGKFLQATGFLVLYFLRGKINLQSTLSISVEKASNFTRAHSYSPCQQHKHIIRLLGLLQCR